MNQLKRRFMRKPPPPTIPERTLQLDDRTLESGEYNNLKHIKRIFCFGNLYIFIDKSKKSQELF